MKDSEREVSLANLHYLTARSPAGQGQRRVFAADDDQVHLRRLVFQEEGQLLVNVQRMDEVIVVEDEVWPFSSSLLIERPTSVERELKAL